MDMGFFEGDDKNVLKLDIDDSCTTLWLYWKLPNYMFYFFLNFIEV